MTYVPIEIGSLVDQWGVPINAALVDQDSRITTNATNIAALQSIQSQGIYIPPSWGQFWRPARNDAGVSRARIICVGGSMTEGYYSSDTLQDSWVGKMRTAVQSSYGNGGAGMFSTSRTDVISSATAGAVTEWEGNGSFATTTGPWAAGAQFFGPGISFITTTAAATATFTRLRGTSIRMFNISGSAPRAPFTYSIDGGPPVNVIVPTGTTAIQETEVTGLSNTDHTVVITWNGVPGDTLSFVGVSAYNSTGVVVDNLGRAGSLAANWSVASALGPAYNGGPSYPGDLVITGFGPNDAASSVDADTWIQSVATYLNTVRQATNGETDIIFVHHHFGNFTNPQFYANYASRMRAIADNYNAAMVNLWAVGRNSWDYWNSFGYWGDANDPGPSGTDNIHASNAGHQFISDTITPIVMS